MLIEYQPTTDKLMTESGAQATDVIKVLCLSDMHLCVCHERRETKFSLALAGLHIHTSRWQGCFCRRTAARQRPFLWLITLAQPAAQVEPRHGLSASVRWLASAAAVWGALTTTDYHCSDNVWGRDWNQVCLDVLDLLLPADWQSSLTYTLFRC